MKGRPFKVLVCGGRDWTDTEAIRRELTAMVRAGVNVEIVHGAARGADAIAGSIARTLGLEVTEYPANWRLHGPAAGPIRNRLMLETQPDLVLAFKDGLDRTLETGGTEHMIRIALKAGVACRIVHDGVVDRWSLRAYDVAELVP